MFTFETCFQCTVIHQINLVHIYKNKKQTCWEVIVKGFFIYFTYSISFFTRRTSKTSLSWTTLKQKVIYYYKCKNMQCRHRNDISTNYSRSFLIQGGYESITTWSSTGIQLSPDDLKEQYGENGEYVESIDLNMEKNLPVLLGIPLSLLLLVHL